MNLKFSYFYVDPFTKIIVLKFSSIFNKNSALNAGLKLLALRFGCWENIACEWSQIDRKSVITAIYILEKYLF